MVQHQRDTQFLAFSMVSFIKRSFDGVVHVCGQNLHGWALIIKNPNPETSRSSVRELILGICTMESAAWASPLAAHKERSSTISRFQAPYKWVSALQGPGILLLGFLGIQRRDSRYPPCTSTVKSLMSSQKRPPIPKPSTLSSKCKTYKNTFKEFWTRLETSRPGGLTLQVLSLATCFERL